MDLINRKSKREAIIQEIVKLKKKFIAIQIKGDTYNKSGYNKESLVNQESRQEENQKKILKTFQKAEADYQPAKYFQINTIQFSEHQPCQQRPDNQSSTIKFQELFPQIYNNVQRIVVKIYSAFFGYSAYSYTLFSFHQSNLNISLNYNVQSKKIFINVNEMSQEAVYPSLIVGIWNIINLDIQMISGNIQILLQIQISDQPASIISIPLSYPFVGEFILNEFEINYGNPPKRLGVNPSCQLLTYLSIGVANQITPLQFDQILDYLAQVKAKLEFNYDFFYTQSNPGELISDRGDLFLKLRLQNGQLNNTISMNSNFIQTYQYDTITQITFSFYIKFNRLPTTISTYLILYFDQNSYSLQFGNNQIQLGSQIINQNIQIWNHIVFIQQYNLYLFINGQEKIQIQPNPSFFTFKYIFQSTDASYQLNHIRIYTGSLLQQVNNCFLQSYDGSCVICDQDFLIDFQNKMLCIPRSSINKDNEIPGVKDWNPPRKVCGKNMINDSSSVNGCKCLIGYYFDGDNCIKCPQYCMYCQSLQDCYQQRDVEGRCINQDAFDDGQDCFLPLFTIPQRFNIRRILTLPDFGQTCTSTDPDQNNFIFQKNQLNYNLGESIYFSFFLVAKTINQVFDDINIATIQDNQITIMRITLSCQIVNTFQILFVKFYIKDQLKKKYFFDPNDYAWIGFWTDNTNFIFMFRTNLSNYYDEQAGLFQFFLSSNIQICVGSCDANLINGCLSLTNNPIKIIKNIPYPPTSEGIALFFSTQLNDYLLLGRYKLDINQSNPINSISDTSGQPSQPQLQFSNSLQIFNQIQGFQLTENIVASIIYGANQYGDLFTLSFNIEFDSSFQYQSFRLLKITNQSFFLEIFLIPDYDQQIMAVQIFYINISKTLRKAVLLLNKSNFFLITARVETQKLSITSFYIDIVCNYIKETFLVVVVPGNQIKQIDFGDITTQNKVFLDNINIYQQNVFVYYDYTKVDPCFVYVNLEYMTCLYLKRGYLYYNNQIVTYEQCSKMASKLNLVSYMNLKDQTCNFKVAISLSEYLCALLGFQDNKLICTQCKDINADPNQNCLVCKKKYFFDSLTNKCQRCDAQCLACKDKSSNCVECQYINQITPNCDCISFQQASQNTCQCNYKCGQCSGIDSNICKTCSSDRRVLPNCNCDEKYEEKQNECVEIQNNIKCNYKCLNCFNTSDNCTTCSQNRINPPLCYCEYGYEEQSDGKCSPCQKGFSYDSISRKCKACNSYSSLEQEQILQSSCLKSLNVTFNSVQERKKYYLRFSFDKNLYIFNIPETELSRVISFYIPEVQNNAYSIINPQFIQNQFQVEINIKANFQADYIYATFLTSKYFLSEDQQYILNEKYLNTQMKTKIGPFLFQKDILENPTLDNVSDQLNQFKSSNKNIFMIINQFQVVFYVLNTLQPVSIFLLLDAIYPPQLYQFYQIVGTFVFPQVPDYLSEIPNLQFSLFGYKLQGSDAQQPDFGKFKYLGFCQSIIVNIPYLLIKQFLILFLISLIVLMELFLLKKSATLKKLKIFFVQRLNGDQETTLAITFICIFIQFQELNEESYIYRMGFYASIILVLIQVLVFKFNIENLKSNNPIQREYSSIYIERVQEKTNFFGTYYFQIQTLKKYAYLAVVCILYKYPILICSICGTLFLISALQTIWIKAYKLKISRTIKFLGEIIFSTVWFIHIFIIGLEQKFKLEKVINDDFLQQYILIGNVALWLLVIYNSLFLVQFILDNVNLVINQLCKKNDNQNKPLIKQNSNIYKCKIPTQNYQKQI
ncbi:hypothetical protein ABPG74_012110 [Tetrahymena malaccensis]